MTNTPATITTNFDRVSVLDDAFRAGWRGEPVADLAATYPTIEGEILAQHEAGAARAAEQTPNPSPRVPRLFPYQGTAVPTFNLPPGYTPYRAL